MLPLQTLTREQVWKCWRGAQRQAVEQGECGLPAEVTLSLPHVTHLSGMMMQENNIELIVKPVQITEIDSHNPKPRPPF